MNRTGDKIDYSLRVQKNVERKILGDIIYTLNYFAPLEKYRYIGFGSCYYKDFLLLHEKYNIHSGISIEIDNRAFSRLSEIEDRTKLYWKSLQEGIRSNIDEWERKNRSLLKKLDCETLSKMLAEKTAERFVIELQNSKVNVKSMNFVKKELYDCKSSTQFYQKIKDSSIEYLTHMLRDIFKEYVQPDVDVESENQDIYENCSNDITIPLDYSKFTELVCKSYINRYSYNKPTGFIEMVFNELINAFDIITWSSNQNNIIWLDYDSFIDDDQLDGLEKSIIKANRGDLIVFSSSMGSMSIDRKTDINDLSHTIKPVVLEQCNDKGIKKIFSKIVKMTVQKAIAQKNINRSKDEAEYKIQALVECVYSDGTPMYTYGFVICNGDDEKNPEYPGALLADNVWFPTDDEQIYEIFVPALTHKEVNAINQHLPNESVDVIAEELPFLDKKKIKQYVDIWRYYPNYLEVDGYV